ncbi:MAG: hypothetical protein CMJ48_14250 [Planctomycetaceae bacterium]|nr:hypothetical protein [Planctomycetaceae bacterium]
MLRSFCLTTLALSLAMTATCALAAERPNIVLIYADAARSSRRTCQNALAAQGRLEVDRSEQGPETQQEHQHRTRPGPAPKPQLYNLKTDVGEKKNLASEHPEKVKELLSLFKSIREAG